MNVQPIFPLISAEEMERRRKLVAETNWSAQMEGLGEPTAAENDLDELWIIGVITQDELRDRRMVLLSEMLAARGVDYLPKADCPRP